MPQLTFYIDETLEYVDKMEKLFKEIKQKDESILKPGAEEQGDQTKD